MDFPKPIPLEPLSPEHLSLGPQSMGHLSLGQAFVFPIQSKEARREILIGALWLLVPGIGWLMNMGHRITMTHQMLHGQKAWPGWHHHGQLFKHGCYTFAGMVLYHLPAMIVLALAWQWASLSAMCAGVMLWLLATAAVPGYMTHYSATLDSREIFNPLRALRRVFECGWPYWKAWGIALAALLISILSLVTGPFFLIVSVWFWQVAAYAFASTFSRQLAMNQRSSLQADASE